MTQRAKQRGSQGTKEQYRTTAGYLKMTRNQRKIIEMNPERIKEMNPRNSP